MYVFVTPEAVELRESCINGAPVLATAELGNLSAILQAWGVFRTTGTTFTLHGVTSFHVTRKRRG